MQQKTPHMTDVSDAIAEFLQEGEHVKAEQFLGVLAEARNTRRQEHLSSRARVPCLSLERVGQSGSQTQQNCQKNATGEQD